MKDNRVGYMRFAVFCVFALLVADLRVSFAQSGWFWQNPLPCGNRLNDVCFVDPNTGIAVGDFGTILRTTDGGNNWVLQASGTTRNLIAVSFADDNSGAIVGTPGGLWGTSDFSSGGVILITNDGGKNWVNQLTDTTIYPCDVCFTDANNGTVVGSQWNGVENKTIVLRTTDGGKDWVVQPIANAQSLTGVYFTDASNGIAVGEGWSGFGGIILRTSDGGSNWVTQWRDTTGISLNHVCLADANNGTAVGRNGTILKTSDGGNHWVSQSSGTDEPLLGVCFADANNGTVVGGYPLHEGIILRTTDGGNNWITVIPSTLARPSLCAVCFTDASTGAAVGYEGTILRTTDGGNHWFAQSRGTTYQLEGVCFADANVGTVVGWNNNDVAHNVEGIVLRTTDGGQHWVTQLAIAGHYFYGVFFTDANTGTAVGYEGAILRTTDGGNHWITQSSGTTHSIRDDCFVDASTGTAVGYEGTILRTTDGGNHWATQSSGTTYGLEGVCFTDADTGMVVGGAGTILRTTDGGNHWTSQSGTDKYMDGGYSDVSFTDGNTGTVVGGGWRKSDGTYEGIILRTTDGGSSWASQSRGIVHKTFCGVHFTDANNGLVVSSGSALFRDAGIILRTTDGGNNWDIQYSGTYGFGAVSFIDPNTATAVGPGGTILRTTTGGVTPVREQQIDQVPTGFTLSQNYPNPFNPTTTIQFSIVDPQFTILKVFDLLGREVATIENEVKGPGTYTVEFNASNLASGVYLYRLKAGGFVQAKKLMILR